MTTNADVLATVDAARARTRRAKRAGWIPLLVFGVLVLPATAFHLRARAVVDRLDAAAAPGASYRVPSLQYPLDGGPWLFWYWQLAIPLGYALVAVLYAVRNRRAGVQSPVTTYVVTGIVLVVALYYFANVAVPRLSWANFGMHGMEATVTIGLALFVLAWIERSLALLVSAVLVTGAALLASQYDMYNLYHQRLGLPASATVYTVSNDVFLSATLLLCAAVVWFVDRRHTRRVRPA